MNSIKKPPIHLIPLGQVLALVPILLIATFFDLTLVYSLALGGVIQILPNLYFAMQAFRFQGARATRQTLIAFNKGEVGKFILTIIGFAVVFAMVKPLNVAAVFGAYVAMLLVQVIVTHNIIQASKTK
ncbi:ATP synthase subunit I [Aurantivibrio infirmus]